MKKLLALVLALVMTLSLCVTSNAAYTDAADVDYKEAVDVLTAVGVFVGDGSGNFYPDQNLTRAQAAKVISYLLLGQKVADGIQGSGTVFTDVAASHWAAGYVEYCASEGVLAGIGDGKFDPNGQLTGLAFAKMLLVALGYDATYEGFTGTNWSINVAKKATELKLFKGNDDVVMNGVVTRQEAAQYAFNALKTQTVTAQKGTTMNVNGVTVVTSGEPAKLNTGDTNDYAGAGGAETTKLYLCEKLYGDKLIVRVETNAAGKSTNTWYYNAKGAATNDKDYKVGAYVSETEAKVIVATKADKSLQYWLETVNTKWDATDAATITVNGAANAGTATTISLGDEILVFTNDDDANDVDKIIVNHYELAQVGTVTKVSGKDYDYTVKIGARTFTSDNIPGFDAETYVKDAVLLVLYKNNTLTDLVSTKIADSVVGKLTKTNTAKSTIEIDGVAYTYVSNYGLNYDDTFTFYLDNNGYVLGAEVKEAADTTVGYVYVLDADAQGDFAGSGIAHTDSKAATVKVKVMYMDGTVETAALKVEKATADLTDDDAKVEAADDVKILKGKYYVTIAGVKYEVTDDKLGNATETTILNNKFFGYSENDDGDIVLTDANKTTGSALVKTGIKSTATTGLVKNETDVYSSGGTVFTANSSTKVVAVVYDSTAKTGSVATYVGYKNFPSGTDLANKDILVCYTKGNTVADTIYVAYSGANEVAPGADVTYAYYVGKYASGNDTFYQFYVNGALETYKNLTGLGSAKKGEVYTIANTTASMASTNYKAIVSETDEAFFLDGAKAVKVYDDKCKVWDLTGDEAVAGTIAEGDSVIYVYTTKVQVAYIVESFVKEHAATAAAIAELYKDEYANYATNAYAKASAALAGLNAKNVTQVVDGATIYLSGKLDTINVDADGDTTLDYDAELTAYGWVDADDLNDEAVAAKTAGKIAVVHVNVNGYNGEFPVYLKAGEVLYGNTGDGATPGAKSFTKNFGGVTFTIDLAGLSF